MRNLILVLGDQLNRQSAAFDHFDKEQDAVWMAEVQEEATHVWCHKLRQVIFFSAMRHFRDELEPDGITVHYHQLQEDGRKDSGPSHAAVLGATCRKEKPDKLIVVQPGDHRVRSNLEEIANELDIELEIRPDSHFYCSIEEFKQYASGRKSLLLETFYRHMRKQHHVLMDDGDPVGGEWNFDHDNRETFSKKSGPPKIPKPPTFKPDKLTKEVIKLVEARFGEHPGSLEHFNHPVTSTEARQLLDHFIEHLLPNFGEFEDAMWTDESFLYHSRLSMPLNLKLLDPRDCLTAAIDAYHDGHAPINSVEGFVRQILGWREFIRGIYWLHMPDYAEKNFFQSDRDVPSFFWDGETDMACVRDSMQHVIKYGYAHHIHRLMVIGNLAQTIGVDPYKFHEWHMAMYLDAIDWVSLPNTLGMSQFGDGGIVGTKPYCSTGNYINKMGNYCSNCRYNYKEKIGENACPFSTFYWHFLDQHEDKLKDNRRMLFPMKNLAKMKEKGDELERIHERAKDLLDQWY